MYSQTLAYPEPKSTPYLVSTIFSEGGLRHGRKMILSEIGFVCVILAALKLFLQTGLS